LRDRVEQALLRAEREKTSVAVLLIDLDNFKQINDSLGHSAGDALLIECARRLHAAARQSDTAARLGGDEFILLVPDLVSNQAAAWLDALASRLNTLLATPMVIADRLVTTPASIGIALYPVNASGFEDLLKMADAAMYASKRQQPGAYQFYSGDMNAAVRSRFELTQDLRAAIGNDELVLYYQPKVSASSGRIVGAEALVRWASPQRGLLPPGMFVPLLDEIGLGNWLGDWVMERACAQMAEWDRQGLPPIPVSVNIAPAQFREGRIIERLTAILNDHALPASRIELEILEATAATGSSEIHATLSGLRAMGVRIALDDFGTGYSSLTQLKRHHLDLVKIDQNLIQAMDGAVSECALVETIISLAHLLGMQVIAEGVETERQLNLLREMGCEYAQGFLVARPMPAEDLAEFHYADGSLPVPADITPARRADATEAAPRDRQVSAQVVA
jgi:diguanylate cyclase (GGDEF)-like protein